MQTYHNPKVLVIDDSRLSRAVIRNTLIEHNMQVTECENGALGLEEFKLNLYDIVLVDTVMPIMDGPTFLTEVRNTSTNNFIPVILMTGNDDLDSKIFSLNIGADDFLQKPINQKELIARVNSLLRLKATHDQLLEKNEIINKEMEAAQKVQQFIIQNDFSHINYPKITGKYIPMENIGGDIFDCYPLPNGDLGILIADVTGHGIPAALIVTMVKMIFSIYAPKYKSTAALLQKVNSEIKVMLIDSQYVTAFYAIYDHTKKIIRYTNAGHPLSILLRKRTQKAAFLDTQGFFIGIIDEPQYEEKAVKVEEGDKFLVYTDGVCDIKDSNNKMFGTENIARFIIKNLSLSGEPFCDELMKTLLNYSSNRILYDDLSLLYIEF